MPPSKRAKFKVGTQLYLKSCPTQSPRYNSLVSSDTISGKAALFSSSLPLAAASLLSRAWNTWQLRCAFGCPFSTSLPSPSITSNAWASYLAILGLGTNVAVSSNVTVAAPFCCFCRTSYQLSVPCQRLRCFSVPSIVGPPGPARRISQARRDFFLQLAGQR